MIRSKESHLVLAFNWGYKLHTAYERLHLISKIVAHWNIYKNKDFDSQTFEKFIYDSIEYTLEHEATSKIKY